MRFILGIGSHGYGGWEVPWSAVLQAGEPGKTCSQTKAWDQKPGKQEQWCPKAEKMEVPAQAGVNSSFMHHFSLLRPPKIGWCPPHWQGSSSLLNLLIHMVTSSRDTPTDTPRRNVVFVFSPVIWASLRPVKLTRKMNHHRVVLTVCPICSLCTLTISTAKWKTWGNKGVLNVWSAIFILIWENSWDTPFSKALENKTVWENHHLDYLRGAGEEVGGGPGMGSGLDWDLS